ncbi:MULTISPECIES: AraC family transcriptional regulator [Paraburkholderia]|uniref:AraC family transcriptional regulator n=1 Tax=Paraburkholderia TaxID=1822464 RepID=UPI0003798132|nr:MULTISPECIES: helix-turn-helix transcriptional regulator [Paraburkholderia]MDH6151105.1 AraC-like DNA-binding protein/quercetin dioxygenase-like cupin family protein [Paraburkholderia sp. WSM4179]
MTSPTDSDLSSRVRFADIPPEFAPNDMHPIRVRSRPMPAGWHIARHTHAWAQVAYASRGVLRVATTGTTWMVPPSRAIWLPPHVTHEVVAVEDAFLRTLYITESTVPAGLDTPRVVEVSNLLREVIAALDTPGLSAAREQLLGALALDELTRSEPLPLSVPMPSEKRLRALCEAVIADPMHGESLEQWSSTVGASTRTIARLFRQELGVSFSQWRQQAILARAIPLLSQGRPLSHVAQELGYQSQSAFSAMFRRAFGASPRAFIERGAEHRASNGEHDDAQADDETAQDQAGSTDVAER